jgi:hypothetical protein
MVVVNVVVARFAMLGSSGIKTQTESKHELKSEKTQLGHNFNTTNLGTIELIYNKIQLSCMSSSNYTLYLRWRNVRI